MTRLRYLIACLLWRAAAALDEDPRHPSSKEA